jgi:hypothetical protein
MRKVETKDMPPGKYYHFGLFGGLRRTAEKLKLPKNINSLDIYVNWDGLPMSDSSDLCFWPLLGKIVNRNSTPFIIGLYSGEGQPESVNHYFEDFVSDLKDLEDSGCAVSGRKFTINIHALIMDAPARAKVLGCVSHGGYFPCLRCTTKGVWVKMDWEKRGRVTYPETNAPRRTDTSFRQQLQEEHHHEETFVGQVLTDIVAQVPAEALHLLDLGVTKRFISFLVKEKSQLRIDKKSREAISSHVEFLGKKLTCDFVRETRPILEFGRWKANEFKTFRDYLGIIVLQHTSISAEVYGMFLELHVSIKLLSKSQWCRLPDVRQWCEELLELFVRKSIHLIGPQFVTYNVHSLIHLPDDVMRFGPVYDWSGYWAENELQKIKHLVVSKHKILEQAVKRIDEVDRNLKKKIEPDNPKLTLEHFDGPLSPGTAGKQFKKLQHGKLILRNREPDNIVYLSETSVLKIENFVLTDENNILLIGRLYENPTNFFVYPLQSMDISTLKVSQLSSNLSAHALFDLKWKGMILPTAFPPNGDFVVQPVHFPDED